ncbi:hypothetical protein HZS_4735 [Henneguya salminicola]|nr:hypothetical protein HZS_4735 [Henneguya salminicola]
MITQGIFCIIVELVGLALDVNTKRAHSI